MGQWGSGVTGVGVLSEEGSGVHWVEPHLAVLLCVGPREQGVEDDDGFVQVPHKHSLEGTQI